MTTVTIARPEQSAVRPTHRPDFTDLTRSEWTKLKTLRSTWWSLSVAIFASLAFTIIATAVYTHDFPHLDASTQTEFKQDTIGLILQPAAQFGGLAVCVLGVLLIASEYSTGMIRATMLAAPKRTSALLAKGAAFGGLILVLAEVLAFVCFFIGSSITKAHASVSLADAGTLRAVGAFGLYMAAMAVISLSVGALVRHTAAGISIILAMQFVLPGVLSLIPGSLGEHVSSALPSGATVMMSSGHNASNTYTPLQGLGILAVWTVVLGTAALVSIKKRDV